MKNETRESIENHTADVEVLKAKVFRELTDAGSEGRTKTELLQAIRVPSRLLTDALDQMHTAFEILSLSMRKRAFALGRPVTRYWLPEFAPKDLTPPSPSAKVNADPEALEPEPVVPTFRYTCRQCGVATPKSRYCSESCERLAQSGGVTVADFLARVPNPLTFARCVRRLVEIDLLCRGFEVTPALEQGGLLLVYDGSGGAAVLHVIPIASSGNMPINDGYEHAAYVFRDGRILYGGRISLVNDRAPVENAPTDEDCATQPETST